MQRVKPKFISFLVLKIKKIFLQKFKKNFQIIKQEQNLHDIYLGGGDTTFSNKLSFTLISIDFQKKLSKSNAKINDDIYITGV